jgi:hypothetical protein
LEVKTEYKVDDDAELSPRPPEPISPVAAELTPIPPGTPIGCDAATLPILEKHESCCSAIFPSSSQTSTLVVKSASNRLDASGFRRRRNGSGSRGADEPCQVGEESSAVAAGRRVVSAEDLDMDEALKCDEKDVGAAARAGEGCCGFQDDEEREMPELTLYA